MNRGYAYRTRAEHDGLAIDAFARFTHSTSDDWRDRFARGEVELHGRAIAHDARVRAGDELVWHRPPWREEDVPLRYDVVFEDAELLAVSKPAGLPTVPNGGFLEHTLLALVHARDPAWTPMHRLGRGTSGLVLFARTPDARAKLQSAWRTHEIEKRYRALASGAFGPQIIRARIGEVAHPRLGTVFAARADGLESESHVESVGAEGEHTRAVVRIVTGRPHQIRVHLAHVGHPLVGDPLYGMGGVPRADALPGDGGYQLHAWRLAFAHPRTGARVELEADAPANDLAGDNR